jgi:hypothetical protein
VALLIQSWCRACYLKKPTKVQKDAATSSGTKSSVRNWIARKFWTKIFGPADLEVSGYKIKLGLNFYSQTINDYFYSNFWRS